MTFSNRKPPSMRPVIPLALSLAFLGTAAFAQHDRGEFIDAFDADRDGRLTRAEYDAGRAARFAATDTDRDGTLSETEYVGEYTARLERRLAASSDPEGRKTEERQRQTRQAKVRFGVLDADRDKRISRAEYDRVGARSFDEQDVDRDGAVTAADRRAPHDRG